MKVQTLEELYRAKFHLIFRYLLKVGCSREDAEDIIQNTFYKAIENMIHLEVENPSAWLFKVATHNYYDLCRKQKRHPQVKVHDEFLENFLAHADEGERFVINQENKAEIHAVINQLKPSQANLLLLKYEMDLSYEQIGNLLNMKIDTVRVTLYRARNQFKKKWSGKSNERL
ncbi:RNA polymerase sigma factor [Cytobacillus kochii]|uniref:RNA polymerase sigma factor n=1 Tax=Cytobacillus kochii TaxID=859143 RepID=UPI00203B17F2|nr:sigma-70 family RNA polymerase sigma factor [Cytobacillus kochii]MCM3324778.1 sigma-70 family RNA polymerase sigma factor [Cytobacillus kochii]MCM3347171.1 sigma-70 family RNA polymerase sigma factor [Cytobacillus kochii]